MNNFVVHKFPIDLDKVNENYEIELEVQEGGKILHCKGQRDIPCLWILLNSDKPKVKRRFKCIVTGAFFDLNNCSEYVGTCHLNGGRFVIHIFEVMDPYPANKA